MFHQNVKILENCVASVIIIMHTMYIHNTICVKIVKFKIFACNIIHLVYYLCYMRNNFNDIDCG